MRGPSQNSPNAGVARSVTHGVMGVFGLHTLLWLLRLGIERVRAPGGEGGR